MPRKPAAESPPPAESVQSTGAQPTDTDETSSGQSRRLPRGINRVELLGRLAADPELRYTPAGDAVCRLRVATNDTKSPEYHDVIVWEQRATFAAEYLTTGRLVLVVGRLHHRSWLAEDGARRWAAEVVGNELQALDFKPQADDAVAAPTDGAIAAAMA